jgi:hypothetical protein
MFRSYALITSLVLLHQIDYAQQFSRQKLTNDTSTLASAAIVTPVATHADYVNSFTQAPEPAIKRTKSIPHYHYRERKPPAEVYSFATFTSGVWVPTGWNKVLGVHPTLGTMIGGWHDRMLYELNLEFRFINAANNYTVIYDGAPLTQNKYFGGFIGMHVGYGVVCMPMTTIYMLTGVGYDGFDVVEGDDTHDPMSINSLNVNFGAGVHHFGKQGSLLGMELTYDVINYNNPGGTPLNGNAFNLRLIIGGLP